MSINIPDVLPSYTIRTAALIELTLMQNIYCIISGIIVGFALGLIGGGGSILAVPLLLFFVGLHDPHVVIGTTALAVGASALSNLFIHHRSGNVIWHVAFPFAIAGSLFALLGSIIGKSTNGHVLILVFALFMLFIAYRMFRTSSKQNLNTQPVNHMRVISYGSGVGFLAGFFGIGGGFLIVPSLMRSANLPILQAIGTSLVAVSALGLVTASSYAWSGLIDWVVVGEYLIGAMLGGFIGVKSANLLGGHRKILHIIFAIFVVLVAFYMLWKEINSISAMRLMFTSSHSSGIY